ncbi:Crp/Fnr family transcriptional regulator [Erythrobacter litoralis]|uniref:Transcriptional regulatory protein n=1 Tax=Erythrobacter litoralis (strain HTCC2594) TaxID=314225 RepID=Q2NCS9_ERYLH|nr:Crp/Fnr family transcriptional regulator [Erythrobacter litoralis]ABC62512.1 transcriptional regulatory protein [Erythrobacter litoralis HTCC2594]
MQDLLAKYGRVTQLLPEDRKVFSSLATETREYARGTRLSTDEFEAPDRLWIVERGRLFASQDLPSGARAITRLYFSGDIVGTANIPFHKSTQTITVNSEAVLYHFSRRKLVDAFVNMPRVAAIFYTFAALENAILNDRLVSIGRTRGRARLASLLLEISSRHNLTFLEPPDRFDLGLTQAQIGDAIGLTDVQVNRLMRSFDRAGLIHRDNGRVQLLDPGKLAEMGQFRDRYDDLDLEWFEEDHK